MHSFPEIENLTGRAGRVLVAIRPWPVRGPLVALVVTRPAQLCLRERGVEVSEDGAYSKYGILFCRFGTMDLAAALPAIRGYFADWGFQNFTRFGYELAGELKHHDADADPRRSYLALERWTWRDYLRARWQKITGAMWVLRCRGWWYNRCYLGDVSRACVALSLTAGALAWLAYAHDHVALVVAGVVVSGLAFAGAELTRPMLSRAAMERQLEAGMDDMRERREQFIRELKAKEIGGRKDE
jgi:hypothetical protein